jgi:polysaccharide export outer membrane protein
VRRSFVVPALLRGLLVTLPMLLAACASGPKVRDVPPEAVVPTQEYRIGPGDALNVFVWNRPELSVNVPVRPDGLISTPLVENMQAAGKNPSQLARDMEAVLAEYVRSPKVNIIVTTFEGAVGDQIRVVGQAAKPQALPYKANLTVLDVMIQVGGLAEFAAGNRAKIVRRAEGKEIEIPVRLSDLLNGGDIRANVPMLPGDVLIIPESRF